MNEILLWFNGVVVGCWIGSMIQEYWDSKKGDK